MPEPVLVNKGETLYDTILTMSALGVDICVIRHSEVDYYKQLIDSPTIQTSIVNGGDGSGQHPSQSLLDLMTIYEESGALRVWRLWLQGILPIPWCGQVQYAGSEETGGPNLLHRPRQWYSEEFDVYGQHVDIDDVIEEIDVLMLLRVQHERHDGNESFSKEGYNSQFGLTEARYKRLKDTTSSCTLRLSIGM